MGKKYQRISDGLYEGVFVLVLAMGIFILLSLMTYHSSDPGVFGVKHAQRNILNSGGTTGAFIADALGRFFGYWAYLFPFGFSYAAWMILKDYRVFHTFHRNEFLFRGIGLLLTMIGGTGCLDLICQSGGWFGAQLAWMMVRSFNPQGAFIVLSAIFFTGITWLTSWSWLQLIEYIGCYALASIDWIGGKTLQGLRLINLSVGLLKKIEFKRAAKNEVNKATIVRSKEKKPVILSQTPTIFALAAEHNVSATPPIVVPEVIPEAVIMKSIVLQEGLPALDLLDKGEPGKPLGGYTHQQLELLSREVEQHLLDFGIQANVVSVHPGPVITRFELQLAAGVKASRLSALSRDLARSLSVNSVRVVEIIPGKTVVGLELPNQYRATVRLNEVLSTDVYQQAHSPLTLALGVDIAGHPMVVDLAKMPHLLVAGTTGSGKSVGINAMILSLLFKSTPETVRLIMVDPKMLELSVYDGIPHLLTPVVTDMKEAASALRWCVAEMERRYRLMSAFGVRNIAGFNNKLQDSILKGTPLVDPDWKPTQSMDASAPPLQSLPYVVVIIDELADMMMVVGKKVEQLIARIAQKARAAGIHLILATQRPSVDVLTGLIKSNIPTRISFQVSSKIDSRTILDQQGAEQLLGHGDMLFLAPGTGAPLRVHGAFVDDQEVHRVAEDWRSRGTPAYIEEITQHDMDAMEGRDDEGNVEERDAIYDEAVAFVIQTKKASISAVQRRFKIGYNRSARLIEEMERTGILGPSEGGMRDVLVASLQEG